MPEDSSLEESDEEKARKRKEFIFAWCLDIVKAYVTAQPLRFEEEIDPMPNRLKVSIYFNTGKTGSIIFHLLPEGALHRIEFSYDKKKYPMNTYDPEFSAYFK